MRTITIRVLFASVFALIALGGALVLEAMGHPCPIWLISVVSGAVGYIFGQVHENGVTLNGGGGTTPSG
jgi:hypothetical protein